MFNKSDIYGLLCMGNGLKAEETLHTEHIHLKEPNGLLRSDC